jgi:ABC-type phosphate/phosphonate transport system substrate-binding protein
MMRTKLALASALAAAALFSPGVAVADDAQDDALWDAFLELGVIPGPHATQVARSICVAAQHGQRLDDVADVVYRDNDVSYEQAQGMVVASVMIYCPPGTPRGHGFERKTAW